MITKFVGIKDFRQNLAEYTEKAKKHNIKFIVLRKNSPVLEVTAIDEKTFALESLTKQLQKAEQEIVEGKYFTQEDMMKEFGLL